MSMTVSLPWLGGAVVALKDYDLIHAAYLRAGGADGDESGLEEMFRAGYLQALADVLDLLMQP